MSHEIKDLTATERDALEALIDRLGIASVLASMTDIATEKAHHVESNWQDKGLAKQWHAVASRLDKLARETVGL